MVSSSPDVITINGFVSPDVYKRHLQGLYHREIGYSGKSGAAVFMRVLRRQGDDSLSLELYGGKIPIAAADPSLFP